MAEWTVKEGKEITGSGKKQFVIKPAYLSSIKMKDNLVYSGEPIKLIENISNISDYSFKLVDSKNESKIFDGIIPVAVNAGTYQLWYLKNDVTEFIGNVIINKATIMLNILHQKTHSMVICLVKSLSHLRIRVTDVSTKARSASSVKQMTFTNAII